MDKTRTRRARRARARAGYTLVELMVGTSILTLLLAGGTAMLLTMLRAGGATSGAASATLDAGNALQRMEGDLREARRFSLLDTATYDATDANNNVVAVTAVQLTFPALRASTTVAKDASGGTVVTAGGGSALWDQTDGATLLFFRANPDGTANPNTGSCLWMRGTESGDAVDRAMISTVAPSPYAVQFIQPYQPGTAKPVANEVQIKLTTAVYDPIHGTASSDSTSGGVTQLTGDCVYLRDHDAGAPGSTTNGHTQN